MHIIEEQIYEMNNLISQTGKFSVTEFQKALFTMVNTYKDYAVSNGDYVITTTKSFEIINGEQVMDVEFLLPVGCRIPVEEKYSFKSKLKLSNALYTKVADITKLQDALNEINQYVIDNNMQPITSAYLVQTKQDNQQCIEVYIGINPNIT